MLEGSSRTIRAGSIEYALVVALIAFAAVVGMNTVAGGNQQCVLEDHEKLTTAIS